MRNLFFQIVKREFQRIKANRTMLLLFTLIPVLLFTMFCLFYSKGLVRNIPVAIMDEDHTELSRTVARFVDATSTLKMEKTISSFDEIKSEIEDNEIYAVFYIPKGTEADVKKGKSASIGLYINCSNMLLGKLVYRYGLTVISTVSGGISVKQMKAAGKGEEFAYAMANPVNLSSRSMFNGNYNYLQYLAPGIITVILQMLVMFAGSLCINSEYKTSSFDEFVQKAKGNVVLMFFGKLNKLI
ncbi:MAG: ABC transporter permease, partial [Bacteroidales bacterium]